MLRRFYIFFMATIVGFGQLAWADLEEVTLQLKWRHQFQFAGYYAAQQLGYYKEAGFDVTILERTDGTTAFERVKNGDATFGIANSSIVFERLNGEPLVVLSTVFQHSALALLTLKDSGIRNPTDLVGKRVAFERGIDDASISAMFSQAGMANDSYELIAPDFDDFALLNSDIDAMAVYISDQPFRYEQRGIETNIINPASYGIDFYGDLIFTSEDYAEHHHESAEAFTHASLRGWKYALANPEQVIDWIIEHYPTIKTREELRHEAAATITLIQNDLIALGTVYTNRFEGIAKAYVDLGMAPKIANLEGIMIHDYLEHKDEHLHDIFGMVSALTAIFAVLTIVLWALVQRLQNLIANRTADLTVANQELTQKLKVIDQHVLTVEIDMNGDITVVSSALCKLSGYKHHELIGHPQSIFHHPDAGKKVYQTIWEALQNGQSWSGELMNIDKQGAIFWTETNIGPRFDGTTKNLIGFVSISHDITHKKLLENLSETDPLTGIANRLKLDRVLEAEWQRFQRYKEPFSIVLLDVDHFKKINDDFGHIAGDNVLQDLANLIKSNLRDIDTIGRWGGEEFLIICPNTNLSCAAGVAEKLRKIIAQQTMSQNIKMTASFGVTSISKESVSCGSMLKQADAALYEAKNNGRNQVRVKSVCSS